MRARDLDKCILRRYVRATQETSSLSWWTLVWLSALLIPCGSNPPDGSSVVWTVNLHILRYKLWLTYVRAPRWPGRSSAGLIAEGSQETDSTCNDKLFSTLTTDDITF